MNAATETQVSAPLCSLSERYTYRVVTSSAAMPNNCWGVYRRVAVIEVDHHERPIGFVPERIADTYGVRVVKCFDRLNVGTTERCAYRIALLDAEAIAAEQRATRAREASEDCGEIVSLFAAA